MKILNMLAIAGVMLATPSQAGEPLSMIKMVPRAATLEYRVNGKLLQSINIEPGTYQITVKQLH